MTDAYRARLVRFYEKYAPDKLDGVDDLLAKSKGKEEKLFAKLVEKYGPEPEASQAQKQPESASKSESKKKSSSKSSKKKEAEEEEEEEEDEANGRNEDGGVSNEADVEQPTEDDYGTRPWWKARLIRFYAKYAPEKTDADVEALLTKAKDNPVQLTKLFQMLEQKYGPEPDPSSSESEEEEEEEEDAQEAEEDDKVIEIPGLRTVLYCPVDGVPPEYSEYFETFPQALPWLAGNVPELKLFTKNMTVAEYAKQQGVEPLSEGAKVAKSDKAQARKRGGGGKKGDGKILIESQERRKKTITTVRGLDSIEGIKLKDVSKALGKKFASGASIKDGLQGDEFIEIQGDFSYDLPQVLIDLYPSIIKKDMIYTVDEDGKKQPAF